MTLINSLWAIEQILLLGQDTLLSRLQVQVQSPIKTKGWFYKSLLNRHDS